MIWVIATDQMHTHATTFPPAPHGAGKVWCALRVNPTATRLTIALSLFRTWVGGYMAPQLRRAEPDPPRPVVSSPRGRTTTAARGGCVETALKGGPGESSGGQTTMFLQKILPKPIKKKKTGLIEDDVKCPFNKSVSVT